jgi:hypothetical protein
LSTERPARARAEALLVALFAAALAAPGVDRCLRQDSARDTRPEGRAPAPRPVWDWTPRAIQALPGAFGSYFDDTCGLRDKLLRWNSLRQLELFGCAPSPVIWAGRDGWWYYGGDDSRAAWRGLLPFRERELESWRTALEEQRDWLRARGIEFLFVIGPNKETIYPEHVALDAEPVGPTRLDELALYLREHSDLPFLDLRPALRAAKQSDRGDDLLYCRLGTHWTARGQWLAYREILAALQARIPALVPPRLEDFVRTPTASQGDSAAPLLYVPLDYRQESFALTPRADFQATKQAGSRPGELRRKRAGAPCSSCLLLRDSFGLGIDDYLAEHFREFVECTQATLDEELVEESQPALVIELFVERKLLRAPPRLRLRHDAAVSRAQFAGSQQRLFLWQGVPESAGIEGLAGARVEPDRAGAGVAITTESPGQTFLTPALPFPRASACVLELVLDSPAAQVLDVFYLHEGDRDFERSRSFELPLAAGRNESYWRFDSRELAGRLRIRPRAAGRIVLRQIELRAVPDG